MNLFRQVWYILTRREKIEGGFLLCAMALGALFEAVSVGLVIPFIAVLKEPELLFRVKRLQPMLAMIHVHEARDLFFVLGPALIVLFAIKSGYLIFLYNWLFRYAFRMHVRLARQLLAGYLSAPYTFHLRRNSAEMVRITTRSVEDFTNGFIVNMLVVLGETLVLGALVILLMVFEPMATLGAMIVLAVPTALIYRLTQRKLGESGRHAEVSLASMIQWTEQAINGVKETLITGRRAFFIEKHNYYVSHFTDTVRALMYLSSVPRFVIDTLAVSALVASAAILLASGRDLQAILPLLGMFALAAIRLIPSTSRIATSLAQLRYRYASTEVIHRELSAIEQYPKETQANASDEQMPLKQALVLDHLSYHYPGSEHLAVDDVSLEIPKGHWVALVGPSGAGKTTLGDLILGLFVPSGGRIKVDGRDMRENLAGWQRNIGYIPQAVYLIDDNIRRNVGFGVPDDEIDDERIWQALRAAQVDRLVRSLPGELDARVGEQGDRLSGGERQRLGIARALYRDPEVLVVDEATANLDPATEAAIVETLGQIRGKKTIIVITHRLPLVRNCDRIYMLVKGRVHNSGNYSELLSKEPGFMEFAGLAKTGTEG